MKKSEVLNAWRSILSGQKPSLSIEITRECPLRCPGHVRTSVARISYYAAPTTHACAAFP